MSSEQLVLVMTAVLAVVALVAASIAVRAARRIKPVPGAALPGDTLVPGEAAELERALRAKDPSVAALSPAPSSPGTGGQVARIVEGRVIVPPTSRQIVDVTMSRPLVRVSVLSHGLAHALRPESRDRISALMRREFQSRRRQRKRAARQAARLEPPSPQRAIDRATAATEAWLGELPAPRHAATYDRSVES